MATIKLQDISMWFGFNGSSHEALSRVCPHIRVGEFIPLIGPSGCGKSTIIDIVPGMRVPTTGRVLVDDQPVLGPGINRGTVFQDYSLFSWKTVFENIRFAFDHTEGIRIHQRIPTVITGFFPAPSRDNPKVSRTDSR
jgi:NitT/TauT family transport system ATP-binding protein